MLVPKVKTKLALGTTDTIASLGPFCVKKYYNLLYYNQKVSQMEEAEKEIFFALEVGAPWPEHLPQGRLLDPEDRHEQASAFLGETLYQPLLRELDSHFPIPPFKVGLVGTFFKCLFLPSRHPNVVAWDVQWTEDSSALTAYRQTFLEWLKMREYHPQEHEGEWLCHVTLCRKPFDYDHWKKSFKPLPMAIFGIHLYASPGHSKYKPIWSYPLIRPFQEIEHTADIAFLVNGENLAQLHRHAQTALAFRYPALVPYIHQSSYNHTDIIIDLNDMIAKADADIGRPFKAISFHGDVEHKDSVLQWK